MDDFIVHDLGDPHNQYCDFTENEIPFIQNFKSKYNLIIPFVKKQEYNEDITLNKNEFQRLSRTENDYNLITYFNKWSEKNKDDWIEKANNSSFGDISNLKDDDNKILPHPIINQLIDIEAVKTWSLFMVIRENIILEFNKKVIDIKDGQTTGVPLHRRGPAGAAA